MRIAYTMAPGRGDTDLVLRAVAAEMAARGLRCCGTVQINTEAPDTEARDAEARDAGPCDMDVRVLPDGPVLRISQHLGRSARGCRLDPAALEEAVAHVMSMLAAGPDLLIVNKFGKHEAEGRGFRDVIGTALALDVPVLVGVNGLNLPAFMAFAGGMAERLSPDRATLAAWCARAAPVGLRAPT